MVLSGVIIKLCLLRVISGKLFVLVDELFVYIELLSVKNFGSRVVKLNFFIKLVLVVDENGLLRNWNN